MEPEGAFVPDNKDLAAILKANRIKRAAFIGPFAQGEVADNPNIIVEFEGGITLVEFAAVKKKIENVLGKRINLRTYKSLHPPLAERILKDQRVIL